MLIMELFMHIVHFKYSFTILVQQPHNYYVANAVLDNYISTTMHKLNLLIMYYHISHIIVCIVLICYWNSMYAAPPPLQTTTSPFYSYKHYHVNYGYI